MKQHSYAAMCLSLLALAACSDTSPVAPHPLASSSAPRSSASSSTLSCTLSSSFSLTIVYQGVSYLHTYTITSWTGSSFSGTASYIPYGPSFSEAITGTFDGAVVTLHSVYLENGAPTGYEYTIWGTLDPSGNFVGTGSATGQTFDPGSVTGTGVATCSQDITAPVTTINSAVDGNGAAIASGEATLSSIITFTFEGTDAVGVVGFECSLDAASYVTCSSPVTYSGLAVGAHTFQVRAMDAAGNVAIPASLAWEVVTPAQAIQNLITTITSVDLPAKVANSLSAPLNNIDTDILAAACGKLNAFVNEVNAKVQNGQLTTTDSIQLLQAANAVMASLGCT